MGERFIKFAIHTSEQKSTQKRICLDCGSLFLSRWIGNRICKPCSRHENSLSSLLDEMGVTYEEYTSTHKEIGGITRC